MMICSSDVASALQMAGVLDYTPALNNNLQVDDTVTPLLVFLTEELSGISILISHLQTQVHR